MKYHITCVRADGKRLYLVDSQEPGGFGWTTAREQRARFPLVTAERVLRGLRYRPDVSTADMVRE